MGMMHLMGMIRLAGKHVIRLEGSKSVGKHLLVPSLLALAHPTSATLHQPTSSAMCPLPFAICMLIEATGPARPAYRAELCGIG